MTKRRQQRKSSSEPTTSSHAQISDMSDAGSISLGDYTHIFVHLHSIGQVLCGQTQGVAARLCQEVALITQGRAQLLLRYQNSAQKVQEPSPIAVSFPVQFRDLAYGTLYIVPDAAQPTSPALPLSVAHLLSQTCALLLYLFELSAFLQGPTQRPDPKAYESLTKRERDVLILMCRGYDQKAIARELSISVATVGKHRQHIYERLGVHNERDALLAAYQAGLFSPLQES